MESRVVANTRPAARHLRRVRRARARSSCSAGSPSGIRRWSARIAAAGPRDRLARLRPSLVYDQTPSAFRDDVRARQGVLEDASGAAVVGYRAPSYSITARSLWALDVLIEEGYVYDASIFPIRHDRYGIPASPRQPYASIERRRGTLDRECPGRPSGVGP